jgi:hypothetical protein
MPQTLFKYLADPTNILKEGFIRLTQLSRLNDPFEAYYCKNNLNTLLHELELDSEGVSLFETEISEILPNIGVVCLTETRDNLLMWTHYANEHKGVVLCFHSIGCRNMSIFEKIFPLGNCFDFLFKESEYFKGDFSRVVYRKQPKFRNDRYDNDYSACYSSLLGQLIGEIFLQKSDEWIYEKEHRAIFHLSQSDKVVIPQNKDSDPIVVKFLADVEMIFGRLSLSDPSSFYSVSNTSEAQTVHVFDLYRIEDNLSRAMLAALLTRLSKNPEIIYMLKLGKGVVSELVQGLKHNCAISAKCQHSDVFVRHFSLIQAELDPMNYSLAFKSFTLGL